MAGYAPASIPPKLEKKPVKFSNLLCKFGLWEEGYQ